MAKKKKAKQKKAAAKKKATVKKKVTAKKKATRAKRKPQNTFMRVMRVRLTEEDLAGHKETIAGAQTHLKTLGIEFTKIQKKFEAGMAKERQQITDATSAMQQAFVDSEVECYDEVDKEEGVVRTKIVETDYVIATCKL